MTSAENDPFKYPSEASQEIMATMHFQALWRSQKEVGLEYLLLALTAETRGTFTETVLNNLGITQTSLEPVLDIMDPYTGERDANNTHETPEVEEVFKLAKSYARERRKQAEPEDLLLASTWVASTSRFEHVLQTLGVGYARFKSEVQDAFRE